MKKLFLALLIIGCIMSMLPMAAFTEGPEAEPVAWYDFEDDSNLGKDKSGKGNDLTVAGQPEQEEAEGPSGKSVYFDGSSALYASVNNDKNDFVDLIETTGTKKLTIAYWVQNELQDYDNFDMATWRRIVSNGHDGGAMQDSGVAFGGFAMLSLLAPNYVAPTMVNPTIMVDRVEAHDWCSTGEDGTGYDYVDGKWWFIVWTADAVTGQFKYYVNGTCIYDKTYDPEAKGGFNLANTARAFSVGCNYYVEEDAPVFNHSYTGSLDELMVFDSVISENDISYYMGLTGADLPTEPVTSETKPAETTPKVTKPVKQTTEPATSSDGATTDANTTAPTTSAEGNDEGGLSTPVLIGIVGGIIVIAAVVAVIIIRKKK